MEIKLKCTLNGSQLRHTTCSEHDANVSNPQSLVCLVRCDVRLKLSKCKGQVLIKSSTFRIPYL